MRPIVSVLIAVRNEAESIGSCLRALGAQADAPELEIIVADGESEDDTVAVVRAEAERLGLPVRIVPNPGRTAATGLNAALAAARGEIVVRVDARTVVGRNHLSTAWAVLGSRPEVAVVGGGQIATARSGAGVVERGISRALNNRYTTGLGRYRRTSVAAETDTVWLGAFRRRDLVDIGGWPTWPEKNQDYLLNERFRRAGRSVRFTPEMNAGYLPRRSYRQLCRQYHAFGRSKGIGWRSGRGFARRHAVLLSVPWVLVSVGLLAARRYPKATLVAMLGLPFVVDEVGSVDRARPAERTASVGATLVSSAAWYVGVLDGLRR